MDNSLCGKINSFLWDENQLFSWDQVDAFG